ncbi:hypothetical protein SANTM175S_04158 [Streptomyces antimycoticus]
MVRIGLSIPAATPLAAIVTASGDTPGTKAAIRKRGSPHTRKLTAKTVRREKRSPTAPYSSAPTSAPPPNSAVSSPSCTEPPRCRSAWTGSSTEDRPWSRPLVTMTISTMASSSRWCSRKRYPSPSSAR